MLRIRVRISGREVLLAGIFFLLVLQNPLESIAPIFSYLDECFALLGVVLLCYKAFSKGQLKIRKVYARIIVALLVFVLSGLLGNYLYHYQRTVSVLIDLFTCLKFFFCIVVGYELLHRLGTQVVTRVFANCAKITSLIFFGLLVADLAFHIFPDTGTRYGLRVVKLFYGHPTYLASVSAFLLAMLTLFYQRRNNLFILMSAVMLFFTLRGKATAGVAIYSLIYFFLLHRRKKIRVWHIILIGLVALFVAWDQFSFYYIELENESARSMLTKISVQILKDYFPIGTGFGTFASAEAAKNYSKLYYLYNLSSVHGLSEGRTAFASDTFWPIVMGQTGIVGLISYVYVLISFGMQVLSTRDFSVYTYSSGIFVFVYLLISSTSESAFCNALSVPFAIIIGIILVMLDKQVMESKYEKT